MLLILFLILFVQNREIYLFTNSLQQTNFPTTADNRIRVKYKKIYKIELSSDSNKKFYKLHITTDKKKLHIEQISLQTVIIIIPNNISKNKILMIIEQ